MAIDSTSGTRPGVGQFLVGLGSCGTLAGFLQRGGFPLPHYLGDWLLITLFLGTAVLGMGLMWRDDHPRTAWRPSTPGRRFGTLVLYTRAGCHLCDDAHRLLGLYADYLPELIAVDIDADAAVREKFNVCVPVVEIDGKVRFRGQVSEPLLQRLIEGTPPLDL